MDDQSKIPTRPSMGAVNPSTSSAPPSIVVVDDAIKRELLSPLLVAMQSHHEETNALVEKCIGDAVELRTEIAGIRGRLEALEARGGAWDNRHSGHERELAEARAEAKRLAESAAVELRSSLEAATARHNELAGKVDNVGRELVELRTNVEAAVLEALGKHVAKIEKAADKLTRTPQVRTAAAVGGTFAGSAIVTIIVEILKHM